MKVIFLNLTDLKKTIFLWILKTHYYTVFWMDFIQNGPTLFIVIKKIKIIYQNCYSLKSVKDLNKKKFNLEFNGKLKS